MRVYRVQNKTMSMTVEHVESTDKLEVNTQTSGAPIMFTIHNTAIRVRLDTV